MKYWNDFLRGTGFPRDVGASHDAYFVRCVANNEKDLESFFNTHKDSFDCFVSVFSKQQYAESIFDTVFIDIDSETLEDSVIKANNVIKTLCKRCTDLHPRINFSGQKGIHLFCDIEPTTLVSYSVAVRSVLSLLKLNGNVDTVPISNNGLVRLPFTRHRRTGLYCVPVTQEDFVDIKSIFYKAINVKLCSQEIEIKPSKSLSLLLQQNDMCTTVQTAQTNGMLIPGFPQCVIEAYRRILTRTEATHDDRILIVMYAINVGYNDADIGTLFKAADDFNASTTNYQIRYIRKRQLKVFSCNKLASMGMCPLATSLIRFCDFFPSINLHTLTGQIASSEAVPDRGIKNG